VKKENLEITTSIVKKITSNDKRNQLFIQFIDPEKKKSGLGK